jgi:hypothetical protein
MPGLLPLRAFDQRHHLTRELAAQINDPRGNMTACAMSRRPCCGDIGYT